MSSIGLKKLKNHRHKGFHNQSTWFTQRVFSVPPTSTLITTVILLLMNWHSLKVTPASGMAAHSSFRVACRGYWVCGWWSWCRCRSPNWPHRFPVYVETNHWPVRNCDILFQRLDTHRQEASDGLQSAVLQPEVIWGYKVHCDEVGVFLACSGLSLVPMICQCSIG